MNGVATFGDERGLGYLVLQCAIRGGLLVPAWGNDDEHHGDLRNCGRRYIADLLCADDPAAEPPCRSRIIRRQAPEPVAAVTAGETAGAFPTGSVVTIPHWIVRAIRSTRAEAMAGEAATEVGAAMEVGVVIDAAGLRRVLICRNSNFLDSF